MGSATEAVTEFVEIAKRCRDEAVNICGPGVPLTAIADVIEYDSNFNCMFLSVCLQSFLSFEFNLLPAK